MKWIGIVVVMLLTSCGSTSYYNRFKNVPDHMVTIEGKGYLYGVEVVGDVMGNWYTRVMIDENGDGVHDFSCLCDTIPINKVMDLRKTNRVVTVYYTIKNGACTEMRMQGWNWEKPISK